MDLISKEDILATKPDCVAGAALEAKAETVGVNKAHMELDRCFVSAMLAGFFIGLGATFMLIVKADPNMSFGWSQVLGGACFSLGLICVIVAGAELFTGNVLMVCAAASKKIKWGLVVKMWIVVWVGNLIGSLVLVAILTGGNYFGMGSGAVGDAMINVAYSKINLPWMVIFFRGMMCNILVCLAVWMGFAGRTVIDKIFTTIIPVAAFVACGFEHCVANMFFLPMGVTALNVVGYTGEIDPTKLEAIQETVTVAGCAYNISAATLGNLVGGAVVVGLAYWFIYRKKKAKVEESK